jgi:iron complex transport system substrate-binding protein
MIPSLDGDVLFLYAVDDDKGQETWKILQNHPIWRQLRVVQTNQVYLVDFDTWRMRNILAANGVVDDLFKYLVNGNG